MHPELEKLIKYAVADGEISEKEKAVIMRKAESLGENFDEVEMILNGELALSKKEQLSQSSVQPKSNKDGDLKKCPSCGAPVPSMAMRCTECGHEFRNTEATQSAKDFYEQLKFAKAEDRALIISNFPVPNNKEDLIEFISMSVGNSREMSADERNSYILSNDWSGLKISDKRAYREAEIKAWQGKAEAAIMKSKILFKDNLFLLEQIKRNELQFELNRNHAQKADNKNKIIVLTFIIVVLIIMFFATR